MISQLQGNNSHQRQHCEKAAEEGSEDKGAHLTQPKPKLLVAMMCERKKHHLLTKTGMAEGRERDKSIGVSNKEAEVDEHV